VVGPVCGAGGLFGCRKDAGTEAVDGEIYASGGVEAVPARSEEDKLTHGPFELGFGASIVRGKVQRAKRMISIVNWFLLA
jgi:hypothetical protein